MIKDRNIAANAAISISKLGTGVLPSGIIISSANIDDQTIITADIADLGVTTAKLAASAVETAKIKDANVTLAKLSAGITPSHVVKFVALGSTITGVTLTGLAVNDVVIRFEAAGTVVVAPCAVADTLPADPADTDYIVVLRTAA